MKTFSLKTQISAVIIALTAALLIVIGTVQVGEHVKDAKEDERRILDNMMGSASTVADVVVPHFIDGDFAYMKKIATDLSRNPYFTYVSIVDTENRIMAHSAGLALGSTLEIPPPRETRALGEGKIKKYFRSGEEYIDFSYPIKAGDLVLGSVRIGLKNEQLKEQRNRLQSILVLDFLSALFIVSCGVLFSSWIIKKFVDPVIRLKEASEKVGQGDYHQAVEVKNRDEVGVLADSFNRMVENLRDSSERLVEKNYVDSIIASMQDALIVLTPEGRIRTVNKAAAVLTGYEAGELLDKSAGILFEKSPDDPWIISTLRNTGAVADIEKDIIAKDGRKIPVLVTCSAIKNENSVQWFVCVARDITERKRTEDYLKIFSRAIGEAMDGVHIVDLNGKILYANRAAEELYSYTRGELIGKHVDELNVDSAFARNVIMPAVKETGAWSGELMRRHKNGYEFPIWLSASMVKNERGEPIGMLGVFRDMTERRHSEEALRKALTMATEEKARSEAVIAAIGDQMIVLDPEFNIIYENALAVQTIGSHIGRKCYAAYERSDRVCDDCPVRRSFQDGLVHRGERIAQTIVGPLHLDMCSSPLKDQSGKVVAVIEMVRDITERKKAEEALRRSHEELEKLVRVRTAELILSNEELRKFSHYLEEAREKERTLIAREVHDELGQSLTALKIELSLLAKRLPPGQQKLAEKTESMAALIESTIQSVKRISTELRPGVLDHLGLTAALEWQAGEFEKRTGIACEVLCEPAEIPVDRDRSTTMFRIFQETLTNVARHAKASKVDVLLKREDGELVLLVQDDGSGITREQSSDTRSLGLIGMRERVHYWGGSMEIRGETGRGTTVEARIPLGAAGDRV